jgi:hypothetical protein
MLAPVSIWFQRKNTGDFSVTISFTDDGFTLQVSDKYANDTYEKTFYLETFDEVMSYLETLSYQVLNDHDSIHPFTYFQYTIPNFPSVLMDVHKLRNDTMYNRFTSALEFHFL